MAIPIHIYIPQERESIGDYLQRYTDAQLRAILRDGPLSAQLGQVLSDLSEYFLIPRGPITSQQNELETLWTEMRQMENYRHLRQYVEELRLEREKLLRCLDSGATYVEKCAKSLTVARLACSAGDILGSVLGMFAKENSSVSSVAFATATALGFASTLSAVTETYLVTNASEDTRYQIGQDQRVYRRVEGWFRQTERLRRAMLNVFPFETTQDFLDVFEEAANSETETAQLFAIFLQKVVAARGVEGCRNPDFWRDIAWLFSIRDSKDMFKLAFFRLRQLHVEAGKIMLQLSKEAFKHMRFPHLPWPFSSDQTLESPLAWARIGLNYISALNAFNTLNRSEVSEIAVKMRSVRKRLQDELAALREITHYADSRRNEEAAGAALA